MNNIEWLIMDVDGTLTDGKIYIGHDGECMKAFNIKDGCGIHDILPVYKIRPAIITGRSSSIVANRCRELGVADLFQSVSDKYEKLIELVGSSEALAKVAYIGDDINDLHCMRAVKDNGGIIGCPADAVEEVQKLADYISPHDGGAGAVRDFIGYICKA